MFNVVFVRTVYLVHILVIKAVNFIGLLHLPAGVGRWYCVCIKAGL